MFTGLVEETGKIQSISPIGSGRRLTVQASKIMDDLAIDDSVAINGVCQTVVKLGNNSFEVEAVEETMRKTTFTALRPGDIVNLERAVRLSDRLGGHIVQGHVDCKGIVSGIRQETAGRLLSVRFPDEFKKYIVPVGSITINGVSLTTAKVSGNTFTVAVIPHTWSVTALNLLRSGSEVNLEFDILGKYIEKLLQSGTVPGADGAGTIFGAIAGRS